MGTCGQQNAPIASLGKIVAHQSNIIGVIKDQQPTLLALLQPLFDRFHELALIVSWRAAKGEQIRYGSQNWR